MRYCCVVGLASYKLKLGCETQRFHGFEYREVCLRFLSPEVVFCDFVIAFLCRYQASQDGCNRWHEAFHYYECDYHWDHGCHVFWWACVGVEMGTSSILQASVRSLELILLDSNSFEWVWLTPINLWAGVKKTDREGDLFVNLSLP